jgi:hypothetical protein
MEGIMDKELYFVPQSLPQPKVEGCAIKSGPIVILMRTIHSARKELFTHLAGKRFYLRVHVYALQDVFGQVCSQEIVCQKKTKQEHTLSA